MTAIRAFQRFIKEIKKFPVSDTLPHVRDRFARLTEHGFFLPDEPWLNSAQLAAFAKFLLLLGCERSKYMSLDLARPLNRYKDFWSAAEKENPYPRDSEYLGAFIFRFVYQQLPFIIFPERIPKSFSRTRAIYVGPSERQLRICSEFEQLSGIPLDIFLGVAERLYSFFLAHPRADGGLLETHLGAIEKGHLASTLSLLAADRSRFKEICGQTQAARVAERPYEFNPLLRFPLIRQGPYLLCPYPELIVYAATRGLYFYLADECGTAFQDNFGHLFSHHAKELTAGRLGKSSMLTEQDERALGWDGKTNDFTVILQDKAVLFECKTSGLFFSSKRGASLEDIRTDLKKNLANPKHRSGLFQLHDKIEAIKSGKLPPALAGKYVPIKEFFPVLLLYDQIQFANK